MKDRALRLYIAPRIPKRWPERYIYCSTTPCSRVQVIGYEDRDAGGVALSADVRAMMHRPRRWDERNRAYRSVDKNLVQALDRLGTISGRLSLPQVAAERAHREGPIERGRRGRVPGREAHEHG
jgi:hypothetical protein